VLLGKLDDGLVDVGKLDDGSDEGELDDGWVLLGELEVGLVDEGELDDGWVLLGELDDGLVDEGKVLGLDVGWDERDIIVEYDEYFNNAKELCIWCFIGIAPKSLHLSNNKLTQISKNTFNGLSNLKHLNIACNQLSLVDEHLLVGLRRLEYLDLQGNRIKNISEHFFKGFSKFQSKYSKHLFYCISINIER
jgi:hypothetical protein